MEKHSKILWLLMVFSMSSLPMGRGDTNNIVVDEPLSAVPGMTLSGVWGTNYVGTYVGNDSGSYSFVTDGTNYFILNDNPLAVSGSTVVNGISGSTIFGYYLDNNNLLNGFLNSVSSTNYSTINDPLGVSGTFVTGVSGGNIIGDFATTSLTNSYFYNGTNFFTLNDTNGVSNSTVAIAISGGGVVGNYQDADTNSSFGFYFDGTNYTTIDYSTTTNGLPFSISAGTTTLTGISGATVVGYALDTSVIVHGFLWNITTATFTPIDVDPSGALPTWITGISGNAVVGNTVDGNGITNGFLTSDRGVSYASIDYPNTTNGSVVLGIGGGTIYGTYQDTNLLTRNFVSDGTNYTTIDGPLSGTTVLAASSNGSATNFVGSYIDVTGNTNSYFYNGTNSTYTTLNNTNALPGSLSVVGISGINVAGTYTDANTGYIYGFFYNGKKYTPLYGPQGASSFDNSGGLSSVNGISGSSVVGTYTDTNSFYIYGFFYTGGTYTPIYGPQGTNAFNNSGGLASVDGLSGSTVFGTYTDTNSGNLYGYRYVTGTGYLTPPVYGPDGTNGFGISTMNGMSGGSVVGTYPDANSPNTYGFIFNGSTYTLIYGPEGTSGSGVGSIIGISGNNVVGTYTDSNNVLHGFLYNATNYSYSVIDFPEALPQATTICGVLGSMIYGGYNDANGLSHGFTIQRGNQSITTYTIPSTNFGVPNPSTTLPLTNSLGLPITYTVLSGFATISNNIVTFTGAGTVTVEASQPGNNAYYAAVPLTNSVAIAKGAQTITFGAVSNQVFGVPFEVSPRASSGLQVSVGILSGSAANSGTSGTTITPTGTGTLVLAANQSGDSNYLAAAQVTNSVTVLQATQSIAPFTGITNIAFTTNPVAITLPAASSALPVTLAATGPATNAGNLVTLLGTGTVTLTASQSGNSNYLAASPVSTNFLVTKGSQTITVFATISTKTFGDDAFSVTPPTASSGLPITLSISSGPATLSNNTLSLTGAGTVTLAADQSGNSNYAVAPEVTTSFAVNKRAQSIAQFSTIPNQQGLSPVTVTNPPTASSGLPVVLSLVSGEATISGNAITPTNSPTTIVVAANQGGDTNYTAAPQVTTSFSVGKTDQTIASFTTIPDQPFSTSPIAVTIPSASSSLPVTLSLISGPATLAGTNLTLTGVGTVVLAANQPGDPTYGPAPQVTTSFVVSKASQTIAPFTTIPNHTYGDLPFSISTPSGGNSGLPVTLSILSGSATLSNNLLTITGAGTITVAADQAGDANYAAASEVTTSFVVAKASQTITSFASIPNQKKPIAVTITNPPTGGGSGQPVIISVLFGPATYNASNNTVTPTNKGVVTLAANQAGNANYSPASQVTTSFLVTLLPQSIGHFSGIITNGTIPYSPKPISVALPKATSTLATKLSILSGPATIVGSTMSLSGTGTVTLAANQSGNGKFAPAPQTTITFVVAKSSQTIALFTGIKRKIPYTPVSFDVTIPKASSGFPVTLSASGAATSINNNIIQLTGVGTVTLTATTGGSRDYLAGYRTTNFVVTQASQTIKPFKPIAAQTNMVPFTLTNVPTASSGLPVSLGISPGFATIVTNSSTSYTITPTNDGSVTLVASQPGDPDYLAAHPVTVTFKVK